MGSSLSRGFSVANRMAEAERQFSRMERVYQGYFSPERQRKILCIGRNYRAHIAELNNNMPTEPLWFDKPMSALLEPGAPFRLSPGIHEGSIHHECEMGVVIGMRGKNIRPEDALKHVAGYFVGIDFTNRKQQQQCKNAGADWALAKGSNDFAAVSEFIHKSAIPDLSNAEIELTCNGETWQKVNTSLMIFDVPTMIADLSRYQELREGDIIFTGTPEGVAGVKAGDQLRCSLRNAGGQDLVNLEVSVV